MRSLVVAAVLLAGCDLYFTDGGDDDVCLAGAPEVSSIEHRDPFTGQCQSFGNGCEFSCGPCAAAIPPIPDWAPCYSACEDLSEGACSATSGCRVVYDANSEIDLPPQFLACWGVAPSGPIQGACASLDAYECSRHDDCIAMYDDAPNGSLQFARCADETPLCQGDEDCGAGTHCSVSDGECLSPCTGQEDPACPAVCYGRCVPGDDPCALIDCVGGTHCEAGTCVPD